MNLTPAQLLIGLLCAWILSMLIFDDDMCDEDDSEVKGD